jgi:hypothetical protein
MKLLLRDLQAGQDYKVQVRANDGQAVSDWSIIYDLTTTVDNVAPNVPTSFVVVQQGTTSIVTWVAPAANTDGTLIKDFAYYEVEAYSDGVIALYRTGVERFEFPYEYNVTTFGQYKTNVGFRVRVFDQSGNASAYTTRTFGTDLAPSQPKPPILLKDTTDPTRDRLFVRHDLMKNDNTGRLETDVNRIKIYSTASASTTPTVAGSTLVGTMMVTGDSVFAVSGTMTLADFTGKHFFVVAQDIGGNISATSPTSPVSGATSALFADVAVISIAYIDYLEANKIKAGSGIIDNITIKSSLIMGAARDGSAPSDQDTSTVPVPITETVMRSANYKYGTDGWIIRGDGYAEFRNLAVNSLNIGKFDQVTQSMVSTKFADFMEDPELWGRHTTTGNEEETGGTPYNTGTFVGQQNSDGAYSARALLNLTGLTSIRRKSAGLNRGISFEPGAIYKVWARIRQLTGPLTNAVNNPTFRGDVVNANTGDTASDGVANFWREYSTITATKTLQSSITGPVAEITTAQRASGTIAAGGHVGFRANTPLLNSGVPNQNAIPVAPGLFYNASAYFKASAIPGTGTAYVAIEWYDAAGALLSTSIEGSNNIGTGVWLRVSLGATAPVGAAIASPRIRFSGSSAGTLTVDFTGVQFTQTASAQTYFDGRSTNHAWSGDVDASPSYSTDTTKYRIGVLGFDDSGNLCAADGSTSADPEDHYMVCANAEENLSVFDGTNSESAGWTEVTGYIKDRTDSLTPPGSANDAYAPAGVHKNVRFIVPFVQMNINDNATATTYIAQLDMFSIESSNTLAPVVIKTGVSKGITIEDLLGDDWSHAIRFYSGNDDEQYPGLMTEAQDADFNQTHTLLIAPPQTIPGERTSMGDGIRLRGRNANILSNSSFENAYKQITSNADFENFKFALGKNASATLATDSVNFHQGWGEKSLKLTSGASGTTFFYHHLFAYKFPELLGQTKLTVSAWVRNDPANPGALNAGFYIQTFDDTGASSALMPGSGLQTTSVPDDGEWYRISNTFDFSATWPDGFPDNTNLWDIGFGFTATGSGQIFNFDDIQVELGGTLTDYKPQAPSSYYMPGGGGMILGNTLVISDRIKSLDEMTNSRWNPELDYEAINPSVQLENDGLIGVMEKVNQLNTVTSNNESYLALRTYDDQGVIQSPWIQLKDSNDEVNPNTIQFLNQARNLIGYMGSLADPTNPEANASGQDLVIKGAFRAEGAPSWTTITNIGTGYLHTAGAYPMSTFNSNGVTYFRGSIFANSATATGGALAIIPVSHRPLVTSYITVMSATTASNTNPTPVVIQVSTAGVLTARNPYFGVAIPTGTIFFFDGAHISTAATSTVAGGGGENPAVIGAASQPTSLTLTPYASSLTTGTYRVGWTNLNDADNAKVRLVWRVDRTPASATDGNVVIISTVNNAAQSYLLSGLPVGRRIYVKLFAVNKAGVINSASPPTTNRFLLASPTVIYANSSASYRDGYGGMWRNDGDQVYQGEWTGNDNHRGVFFYGTQIQTRLNTGSVARTPTKMTIYMQRTGSGGIYGSVPIDLYPTTQGTKPAGAPVIVTSQTRGANIVGLKPNQGATITIPSSWYPVYTSGTYKGFAVYNAGSDYAIMYGRSANSAHGKLTIYHKG